MNNKTVNFSIVEQTSEYLVIADNGPWDQHLTITNGAEIVVAQLAPKLNGRKLYYYDTDGRIDQLGVSPDGQFTGFIAGGPDGQ